jgi:predicted 3-demethylubiquinone-9 3-methyltransferase (glyoxalase superfamily)
MPADAASNGGEAMTARPKVMPFLMFTGQAEEALNFYVALLPDSRIESLDRYGPAGPGAEGSVFQAVATIGGQRVMCIDSPAVHTFTFTPSFSLYVTCDSEDEIDRYFARLSDGGQTLMPLDTYPFSRRYAWVQDRYGVSWQLSLA